METKQQKDKLPQGDLIGSIPFIQFAEDNEYRFCLDFSFTRNIPSHVRFYPFEEFGNGLITFIGDGYGILAEHSLKYGLVGQYGNGSILVYQDDIPHLLDWCRANFLKPLQACK